MITHSLAQIEVYANNGIINSLEKEILLFRDVHGKTFDYIGKACLNGVSRQRVYQRYKQAKDRITSVERIREERIAEKKRRRVGR